MRSFSEHDYITYPRRFDAYKWYKPLLVGLLFLVFYLLGGSLISVITKLVFGATTESTGYDDMDVYTAAGAFENAAIAAVVIPCILIAALIVRDRPCSSYWSSMGGWRWKVFLKTLAAAIVILGMPNVICLLIKGRTGDVRFTIAGFIILLILCPLQGVGEELQFRGFVMQTVGSWFRLPVIGIIVQTAIFTALHPYNVIGVIEIGVSAVLYALVCIFSKGLEAPSALHMVNNMSEIFMAGFGFGALTAEETVPDMILALALKTLFFLFILFADKKLHWFDEVKKDDAAEFNAKIRKKLTEKEI